jgi:hypothetical protein
VEQRHALPFLNDLASDDSAWRRLTGNRKSYLFQQPRESRVRSQLIIDRISAQIDHEV